MDGQRFSGMSIPRIQKLPASTIMHVITGERLARQTNIRVLFVFDPWRSAILLVAGDKTGQWHKWYEEAIPQAEMNDVFRAGRSRLESLRLGPSAAPA